MTPEERRQRLDICNKLKEKVNFPKFSSNFLKLIKIFPRQEALLKLESHLKSQLEIVNNHRNQEVSNEAIL